MPANGTIKENIYDLGERLKKLEERFIGFDFDTKAIVQNEFKKRWRIEPQANTMFGLTLALCVATQDPWKQNRVQYYTPLLIDPSTQVDQLPWAFPISSAGGFDDCGMNWVPPAGSTLIISFEQGDRRAAFYHGTTWHRDRGTSPYNWNYQIPEFMQIYDGHRLGYLVGPNDGSQVFPQQNTESYNGYDIDSQAEFDSNPAAQQNLCPPNIYSFKTPEKHGLKMVDGNPDCNRRWKRLELQSGCGNGMIFKDDHIHPAGQWAHPSCGCDSSGDLSACNNSSEDCQDPTKKPKCANPFFKHQNECRMVMGPQTPQNNKLALDQSGIQFLSKGGHSLCMDDSVEQPQGIPTWEQSIQPFDWGCTNKCTGKFFVKSMTGHAFTMSDVEEDSQLRGDKNYIQLLSACGNRIELNDHTTGSADCPGCPPNLAGSERGITLESTSKHIIKLCDEENAQCSPCRAEGGVPTNQAKKAYIQIRSGYGLQILLKDDHDQQNTDAQYIQIFCPQKDNTERGPHIEQFQERPSGPGLIFLRAGGNYIIMTYDDMYTVVGDPQKNPSDKLLYVTKNQIIETKQLHYHYAQNHLFYAEEKIFLLAGKDCPDPNTGEDGPCVYNVVINRCAVPCPYTGMLHFQPGLSTSEYVFASGKSGCGG